MACNRLIAVASCVALLLAAASAKPVAKHVIILSIDGFHKVDLDQYLLINPNSTLSTLAKGGVIYTDIHSPVPSYGFPGALAFTTGGSPVSTGVYNDVSYDRSLYAATDAGCLGATKKPSTVAGTVVTFDSSINIDSTKLSGGGKIGAGADSIDPTKLPFDANCSRVYPHNYLRVNTIFEVVKAAGLKTAWADASSGYEILNGPSGTGIDDLYTPEFDSLADTTDYNLTVGYDNLKVAAILNQIAGLDSRGTVKAGVPALFGMSFQAVAVAQKQYQAAPANASNAASPNATGFGYRKPDGTPSPELKNALQSVDTSIGKIYSALNAAKLIDQTAIIVTSKHGMSPIDHTTLKLVDNTKLPTAIGAVIKGEPAFQVADTSALIWLSAAAEAQNNAVLTAIKSSSLAKGLNKIVSSLVSNAPLADLQLSDLGLADPTIDPRAPSIYVESAPGVLFASPAEILKPTASAGNGGFSDDDTHVGTFVFWQSSGLIANAVIDTVDTTSIAATALDLLGLSPTSLKAAVAEATTILPGLVFYNATEAAIANAPGAAAAKAPAAAAAGPKTAAKAL